MRFKQAFSFSSMAFLLLALAVPFMACANHGVERETKAPVTLTIWTLQLADFKDYLEPIFRDFEKTHPGTRVNWVDIPFSEGEKKALTAILSKQAPDVINLNPDFSAVLADKGTLLNMNDWVSPSQRAQYLPVAWQACSLKPYSGKPHLNASEKNAKTPQAFGIPQQTPVAFGIPWYITSAITYENNALLKEARWRRFPRNEVELKGFAKSLRARGAHYAYFPTLAENGKFLKYLFQSGIDYELPSGLMDLDTPPSVAILTRWVEMYQQGLLPKESLMQGHQDAMERYQSGSLAMLVAGTTAIKNIESNAPGVFKSTRLAPQFPQLSATASQVDFSVMTLVVPKTTDYPKEAVELALLITNEVNGVRFSQRAPVLPSSRAALRTVVRANQGQPDFASRALALSGQQLLTARQAFQIHPIQKQLNQVMDFYIQKALLGVYSPAESLRLAERDMNDFIQK